MDFKAFLFKQARVDENMDNSDISAHYNMAIRLINEGKMVLKEF